MEIECPHCKTVLSVDGSQAGLVLDCPRCTGRFHVPVPVAKPRVPGTFFGPDSPDSYESDPQVEEFVEKKFSAGICALLFGIFGLHKFLLGLHSAGLIMLAVSLSGVVLTPCLLVPIFGPFIMWTIGVIEGIIYLSKSEDQFYQDYAIQRRQWF